VRGLDGIVPHETVVGVALVVGQDEDDIWWLFGCMKAAAKRQGKQGSEEKAEGGFFHLGFVRNKFLEEAFSSSPALAT
jgi:hypothetical protein